MKVPKRLREIGSTPSHSRAPRQEKELAKKLKGSCVPRSGAGYTKGDVRISGVLRLEAKTTKHKSFSVTSEMLEKIDSAASSACELPALVVEVDNSGEARSVAIIPMWAFEELIRVYGLEKQ